MKMSDVAKRVKDVVAKVLKVDADKIGDSADFVKDLGAESVQSLELVASFEDEFDIEMDEDEALGVKTVNDAITYIDKILAEG